MNEEEIDRLSELAGVSSLDEWREQLKDADSRIEELLKGTVSEAWTRCLPTWLELGRVTDLSRALKVPKYFPSFATLLGRGFAQRFEQNHESIVHLLRSFPPTSHEYLIAFDLISEVASNVRSQQDTILEKLCEIDLPLPRVVAKEILTLKEYVSTRTVGDVLKVDHHREWGDE